MGISNNEAIKAAITIADYCVKQECQTCVFRSMSNCPGMFLSNAHLRPESHAEHVRGIQAYMRGLIKNDATGLLPTGSYEATEQDFTEVTSEELVGCMLSLRLNGDSGWLIFVRGIQRRSELFSVSVTETYGATIYSATCFGGAIGESVTIQHGTPQCIAKQKLESMLTKLWKAPSQEQYYIARNNWPELI